MKHGKRSYHRCVHSSVISDCVSHTTLQPDSDSLPNLNECLRSVLSAGPPFVTSRSLCLRVLDLNVTRHRPELDFDIDTQKRLLQRNAWLNSSAVDNTARLLQCRIQDCPHKLYHIAADCAILPSSVIGTIERNASDYDLYRACMRSRWWATHVWLVPIHRVDHWVLGVLNHHVAEIWFYDSFGEDNGMARRMDEMKVRAFFNYYVLSQRIFSLDSTLLDETARCHRQGAQDVHHGPELLLSSPPVDGA
jgi:hypothetical protein